MEDILALVVVLVLVGGFYAIGRIVYKSYKRHKAEEAERFERKKKQIEDYYAKLYAKPTPSDYAKAMTKATKPKSSYAKVHTKSTATASTTTSTPVVEDNFFSGVVTGMLIDSVVNSITHKSGGSDPIDFPKTESSSSWGLDDSDSRKSVSSSMDTSSSWSSSSDSYSSSSDSGPSSDW
jgi:hypothetical protein